MFFCSSPKQCHSRIICQTPHVGHMFSSAPAPDSAANMTSRFYQHGPSTTPRRRVSLRWTAGLTAARSYLGHTGVVRGPGLAAGVSKQNHILGVLDEHWSTDRQGHKDRGPGNTELEALLVRTYWLTFECIQGICCCQREIVVCC